MHLQAVAAAVAGTFSSVTGPQCSGCTSAVDSGKAFISPARFSTVAFHVMHINLQHLQASSPCAVVLRE